MGHYWCQHKQIIKQSSELHPNGDQEVHWGIARATLLHGKKVYFHGCLLSWQKGNLWTDKKATDKKATSSLSVTVSCLFCRRTSQMTWGGPWCRSDADCLLLYPPSVGLNRGTPEIVASFLKRPLFRPRSQLNCCAVECLTQGHGAACHCASLCDSLLRSVFVILPNHSTPSRVGFLAALATLYLHWSLKSWCWIFHRLCHKILAGGNICISSTSSTSSSTSITSRLLTLRPPMAWLPVERPPSLRLLTKTSNWPSCQMGSPHWKQILDCNKARSRWFLEDIPPPPHLDKDKDKDKMGGGSNVKENEGSKESGSTWRLWPFFLLHLSSGLSGINNSSSSWCYYIIITLGLFSDRKPNNPSDRPPRHPSTRRPPCILRYADRSVEDTNIQMPCWSKHLCYLLYKVLLSSCKHLQTLCLLPFHEAPSICM